MMTLVFGFTACNSDDDGPGEPPFTIVGTWKVTGKLINGVPQDISGECVYNGKLVFIDGGVYTEEVYIQDAGTPCHLDQTIGGNWEKNGNSYKVTISTPGGVSILPATFTPIIESGNNTRFEISASSLGTTTTLIFAKQ